MVQKTSKLIVLSLIALFSVLTVIKSFYYSGLAGGSDLRNRVVGARLIGKRYSPYFYKWNPADGERFLDPNDEPSRLTNGNTVTPAVFYVIYPLTYLNYPAIRLIWTMLELLAAVAVVCIMLRRYSGTSSLTAAGFVILGLLCSEYWLEHIERGQMNIFYVFFFALMYYAYTAQGKYGGFISGFIGGLFMFFRPFAGIIGLGFLLHGKMQWVKGCIAGALAGILIFVAPNPAVWRDYFKAMTEYGNECLNKRHIIQDATYNIKPVVIEGAANLTVIHDFRVSIMPGMYWFIGRLGIDYNPIKSYLVCGCIVLILSLFFFKQKPRSSPDRLFLFAFLVYMVAELFLLSWRSPYLLIEWVFPLFLIVREVEHRFGPMILLFTALLLIHNNPFYFNRQSSYGEVMLLLMIIYIVFSGSGTRLLRPD